jgi:hypothetical protein
MNAKERQAAVERIDSEINWWKRVQIVGGSHLDRDRAVMNVAELEMMRTALLSDKPKFELDAVLVALLLGLMMAGLSALAVMVWT